MQRPPARRRLEHLLGTPVGQPRSPRHRAQVRGCRHPGRCWPAIGQEQRAARPTRDHARQQPRGPGLQVQPLDIAALGPRPSTLVLKLQILDVQRQNLAGPRRGFIEQPPQRLLADRDVVAAPEPLKLRERDRSRAVRWFTSTGQHVGQRLGDPAPAGAERRERPQGREVTIPRRGCTAAPRIDDRPLELASGDPLQWAVGPELTLEATKCLRIGASARVREVGLSEECVDRLDERRRLFPRWAQPPTRPARGAHRRECVIDTPWAERADPDGSWWRRRRSRGNRPFPATPYEPRRTPNPASEVSVATARGGTLFVETDGSVCPTGFPFKVHQLEGALSDHAVRDARERKRDLERSSMTTLACAARALAGGGPGNIDRFAH